MKKSYYLTGSHGVVKQPLVSHKGLLLRSINAYGEKPFSVVRFCPISDSLVAVDERGNVFLFDIKTKRYDVVFRFGFTPDKLVFSPQSERPYEFLVSNIDGKIICANLRTRQTYSDLDHSEKPRYRQITVKDPILRSISYHPIEENVLVSCTRQNVHFWKLNNRCRQTVNQNYYLKEKKFHSRQEKLRSGVYYYSKKHGQFIFLSILNQEILKWRETITLSNHSKNRKKFGYEMIDRIELPTTAVVDIIEEGATNEHGLKTNDQNKVFQTQEYISCFDIFHHFIVICTSRSNVRVYNLETCALLFSTKLPLRPRSIPLKGEEFIPKKVKFIRNSKKKIIFSSPDNKSLSESTRKRIRRREKNKIHENSDYKDFAILHRNDRKSVLLFFHVLNTTTSEIRCFGPPKSEMKTVIDFDISRNTNYLCYSNGGYELFTYKINDFIKNRCTLYHYPKEPFPLHSSEKNQAFKRIESERDQLNDLLDKFGEYPDKYRGQIWKTLLMVNTQSLAATKDLHPKEPGDNSNKIEIPSLETYENDPQIMKLVYSLNEIADRGIGSSCKYIKNPNFQALLIAIYKSIPQIRDFLFRNALTTSEEMFSKPINDLPTEEEEARKIFHVEDIPLIDVIYPFYRLYGEHDLLSSYDCCLSFLRNYRPYFLYHDFSPSSYYNRRSITRCHFNLHIMDLIETLLKQLDEKLYLHIFHVIKPRVGAVVGSAMSPADVMRRLIWKNFIVPCFTSNFGIRSWYRFMDHVLSRCYNLEECLVGYLMTHRNLIFANIKTLGDFTFFSEQIYTTSGDHGVKKIVSLIESVKAKNKVSLRKRWEPLYYFDHLRYIKDNNPRQHHLKTKELDIETIQRNDFRKDKNIVKNKNKRKRRKLKQKRKKKIEEEEEEGIDGKERETGSYLYLERDTLPPVPRSEDSIPHPASDSFIRPMLEIDAIPPGEDRQVEEMMAKQHKQREEKNPILEDMVKLPEFNESPISDHHQEQQQQQDNINIIPSQEFSLHLRSRRTQGDRSSERVIDGKEDEEEGNIEIFSQDEEMLKIPPSSKQPVLLQKSTSSSSSQQEQQQQTSKTIKKKKRTTTTTTKKKKKKKKKKRVSFDDDKNSTKQPQQQPTQKKHDFFQDLRVERERKLRYKEKVDTLKQRLIEKEREIKNLQREVLVKQTKIDKSRQKRIESKIERTRADLKDMIQTKFDDFMFRQKKKEIDSRVHELDDISTGDVSISSSSSDGGDGKLFDIEFISSSDESIVVGDELSSRDDSLFSIPSQVISDSTSSFVSDGK